MKQPVVAVDVDGVCADWVGALLDAVDSDLSHQQVTCWDVFSLLTPEQAAYAKEILKTGDFWAELPTIAGSIRGVWWLQRNGFDVVFATSPWLGCETWGHVRHQWIKKLFGFEFPVLVVHRKELVRAEFLIDDKPSNIELFPEQGILFDQPYNQDCRAGQRVHGWDNTIELFKSFNVPVPRR